MHLTETLRLFLDGIGRSDEYEHYIRRFQSDRSHSFALIVPDLESLEMAPSLFHFQIRTLVQLGLIPTILLAGPAGLRMKMAFQNFGATIETREPFTGELNAPVLFMADGRSTVQTLLELLDHVAPRIHFVRLRGSFRDARNQEIPYSYLRDGKESLVPEDQTLFEIGKRILETGPGTHVSVTSPANLLKEIFTIRGAGTVIRRGSRIHRFDRIDQLDREKLLKLFERSFGRPLENTDFLNQIGRIYLEENYRGVALLMDRPEGMYLSKFSVDTDARGEGIAQEIWLRMEAECPSLFWRSRKTNSINRWYTRVADGLHREDPWILFWKGVDPNHIPEIRRWVLSLPEDFKKPSHS